MKTIDNQKYLLSIGNLYSTDAIHSIKNNKILDNEDKEQCIDIVMNNDFKSYCELDTLVREELMDSLEEAYCFFDADALLLLSDLVIRAIEENNRAAKMIHNNDAIDVLDRENKKLQELNSKLIRYATKLNPEIK